MRGRVQGVGFRYTAKHLSNGFAVAGYVRNRPDGRVELLAQGPGDQVDGFLAAIAQQLAGCIDRTPRPAARYPVTLRHNAASGS